MKWYDILCPRCGWNADMVDERVANEIRKVRVCQNCQAASPPETVEFVITEHITNTTRR